eukprot:430445-Pyramimonas_sp.AAC.1
MCRMTAACPERRSVFCRCVWWSSRSKRGLDLLLAPARTKHSGVPMTLCTVGRTRRPQSCFQLLI